MEGILLYHYFEKSRGPFRSLSDLHPGEAEKVLRALRGDPRLMAAGRDEAYLKRRRELEQLARALFISKGGQPRRWTPHYMVIGACPWLETWYLDPGVVQIALETLDPMTVSFSYGDLFPTFSPRVMDGREYRRQVYTLHETLGLIERYGYPQDWNPQGKAGPERYIEAQVWDDRPIRSALKAWECGGSETMSG